ncbi:MAG: hypothetical protein JF593_09855 [Novosphingobium sp.]|nr:hypothetical protein [Novosphingobium sp.]
MALASRLFRGNAALEACAVRDAAHILQGARGEHVGRIQFALFRIDGINIDRSELSVQLYGRSTANAVLSFKQRRSIINRSYQSTADDIVGRMTIAALDQEMLRIERARPLSGDCTPGRTGRPDPLSLETSVRGPGRAPPLGALVKLLLVATRSALADGFPLRAQLEVARDRLFEHGITIGFPLGPENRVSDVIDTEQTVVLDDDAVMLRKMSENIRPAFPTVLRVILCRMAGNMGETKRGVALGGQTVPPFVLLNSRLADISNATLLHEMIHASHLSPQAHDAEPSSIFFVNGSTNLGTTTRSVLKRQHAVSIANSFYAK